jgi:hypothetical protein
MATKLARVLCVLAAAGIAFSVVAAEPAKPAAVQTRVKRVALFKNGLGFFVREGTLTGDASNVLLGPFAAPSHGTFWVSCPPSAGLKSVVAREVTVKEETPAATIRELFRANTGREVILGEPYQGMTGTVLGFASDRYAAATAPDPYAMGPPRASGYQDYSGPGEYVLFRTVLGTIALDPGQFSRVQFTSPDFATSYLREVKRIEVEAAFSAPKKGDWLSVSYLAKGIAWAPSYVVDISHPKAAQLSASATIINEAERLDGAHVDLITGFPNLAFADVVSPIARKEELAAFLNALTRGRSEPGDMGVAANVLTQSAEVRVGRYGGRGGGGAGMGEGGMPGAPSYGAAAVGQATEDLFLYPLEEVKLNKGEVGNYPLFTETVPYEEVYQWEIPDYITPEEQYRRESGEPHPEVVWHNLRLTNDTKLPWTTAPVQLMKEGQIIGQDTLNYTPMKAQTTVRITRALSVKAEQAERETTRQREAVQLYGDYFDRVAIAGTLRATNYQDKPILIEVKKTVSGDVQASTPSAEDVTLARGLARMNPVHELTWALTLKPGEGQQVTYAYSALIRR